MSPEQKNAEKYSKNGHSTYQKLFYQKLYQSNTDQKIISTKIISITYPKYSPTWFGEREGTSPNGFEDGGGAMC